MLPAGKPRVWSACAHCGCPTGSLIDGRGASAACVCNQQHACCSGCSGKAGGYSCSVVVMATVVLQGALTSLAPSQGPLTLARWPGWLPRPVWPVEQ